jgi:hypothetical protein
MAMKIFQVLARANIPPSGKKAGLKPDRLLSKTFPHNKGYFAFRPPTQTAFSPV